MAGKPAHPAPARASTSGSAKEPTIENRKARHEYLVEDTLEVGMKLTGTEIKSVRNGQVSLAEGFARLSERPPAITLHGVHIAEYPPADPRRQHAPTRVRTLLAHAREIRRLAARLNDRGTTLIPLKLYFVRGRAKLLLGIARGKRKADKRQDIARKEARRDIDRALSRRRG